MPRWAKPAATVVLALGLPAGLAAWVEHEAAAVTTAAAARLPGTTVTIGAIEADLTGTLRFDDVHVGGFLDAESIEASLGPTSILSGALRADEVRVAHPRVRLTLDDEGRPHLPARVARGQSGGKATPRARRIVVTEGVLEIALGDRLAVRASGVELHPTAAGVRVVTGEAVVTGQDSGIRGELRFERAGLDVDLPDGHVRRAVASGGALSLTGGDARLALEEVVVQHGVRSGELQIDARTPGGQPASATLVRNEGRRAVTLSFPALPVALVPRRPAWLLPAGTVAGVLEAKEGPGGWEARLDLRADGLGVRHELAATAPLVLGSTQVTGTAHWDPRTHLGGATAHIVEGGVTLDVDLDLGETGAEAHLRLPATPCAAVLAAVPEAVRSPLDGMALDGTLALDVAAHAPLTGEATLELALDLRCQPLAEAAGKDPRALLGGFEHRLPDGRTRRFAAADPDFTALDRLPHHVAAAFVSAEDGRFYRHRGIDPIELERSFAADVAARKPLRGGSTLSQQVAKNLWLGRDRTVGRKLVEAALTWRLEAEVPKRRILEIYLSLIELGEGVFGIGPGARRWFDRPAQRLSVAQAAFLAAITPEPRSAEKRIVAAGGLDPRTRERVRIVLGAMRRDKALSASEYEHAIHELAHLELVIGDARKAELAPSSP